MGTFDYFVAPLGCPSCGRVTPDDASTNMQTAIRAEPDLAYLRVGDSLQIDLDAMEERGYLTIHRPLPGEEVRILQIWECPLCQTYPCWALIKVAGGKITSIQSVSLTRAVLEDAHFIDYESKGTAAALVGKAYADLEYSQTVDVLRKALPG